MSGFSITVRSLLQPRRLRSSVALLFAMECAAGIIAVWLAASTAHWLQWLLPVSALLCLMVVVPVALWCGFWQAVVVSLAGVLVQSYYTTRQPGFDPALDTANSITLMVFVLTALLVSRLSAQATEHARASHSWGGQMHEIEAAARFYAGQQP